MPEDIQELQTEEKTFTQSEVNDIVKNRLERVEKKYADYAELQKKAKAFDEAKAADMSELDKARTRADEAEAKLSAYEAERAHKELVKKVMNEYHIDAKFASLLTASDEEALKAQAQLLQEKFAEPVPSDTGKQVDTSSSAMAQFASSVFSKK